MAGELNVSKSSVSQLYESYLQTNSMTKGPGTGPKRKTTPQDNRFMIMTFLRNRTMTAVGIQNEVQRVRGVAVSSHTIRRRLKQKNMTPERGAIGPKLSPRHGAARLRFALEHVWTKEQWSSVLFTCSQMRAELVYICKRQTSKSLPETRKALFPVLYSRNCSFWWRFMHVLGRDFM